jgi:glycosyltransferase involved in cell wall biosynthesis
MSFDSELRVLMVIPSYFPLVGGAEKQVAGLVNSLGKISCKATILTRLLPNTSKIDVVDGISIIRLKTTKYRIVFLLQLSYFLFKNRFFFDVIHVHTLNSPAIVSAFVGRLTHTPVIVKVTRSGKDCQLSRYSSSNIGRLFFCILSALVTRFIAITDDVRKELLSFGVQTKKIIQIPNGVELPVFNSLKKDKQSSCIFVYVGRLIDRKRVDWLINAFFDANLNKNDRLIIIGAGIKMDSLVKLTLDLGLGSRVEFMGEISHDKVIEMLLLSDVFVLPSDSEGMSNSLLESMASNNAVIAANIPANKGLIMNGINGLLFSTIDDLSRCLYEVSNSDALRTNLSKNANNDIRKEYSFKTIAQHYKDSYNSLI